MPASTANGDEGLDRLADLLERSAERNMSAWQALREELVADRRRDDERLGRLERDLDELVKALRRIDTRLGNVERRSAVLVDERDTPDGPVVTARPATVGIDVRTGISLIVAFASAVVVPIVVAVLSTH